MPNIPGTSFSFQENDATLNVIEADTPTCVIGVLYNVVEDGVATGSFDPLDSSNQAFEWPSKPADGVVDLTGVKNGRIDSQRSELADMPIEVSLRDQSAVYPVSSEYVENVDQDGIELKQGARTGLDRGSFDVYALEVNNEQFVYAPGESFSSVVVGDRALIGAANLTVESRVNRKLTFEESLTTVLSTATRVKQNEGGSVTLSITPSATAGRVVATITGTTFAVAAPTVAVGDLAVIGKPISGLVSLEGNLVAGGASADGLTLPSTVSLEDIDNYIVKVVEYTTTDGSFAAIEQTHFVKIADYDAVAGTIDFDSAIVPTTALADVKITVLSGVVGVIESINDASTQLTITAAETFSDSLSFVDIYLASSAMTVYPEFEVLVSYRSFRTSIADTSSSVSSLSDFLEEVGHSAVDYRDGLGWAMRTAFLSQGSDSPVYYVVVDPENGGVTGLPENRDLVTAYSSALESIETAPVYNVVLLDRSAALDGVLQAHVDAMSTPEENSYRRGFFTQDFVVGDVESTTGIIEPGRTSTGIAASATTGNAVIRDDSVLFVTEANVTAGTVVVVTFPSALAGSYVASGDTTDNTLVLQGNGWPLEKEFTVATLTVDTNSPLEHTISGAAAGQFVHVEAGDYVEFTESAVIYRLRVISVNAAGTQVICDDSGAGVDFGTGNTNNATSVSVIRSWNPTTTPGVKYHIRPLTKAQQVARTVAAKSMANERYSLLLAQTPTMVLYTDASGVEVSGEASDALNRVAVAARRSGAAEPHVEITYATLAGITSVKHGFDFFKKTHLKSLSDAGFVVILQNSKSGTPYIMDMITTLTTQGLVKQEEMVIANADWIGKTLSSSLQTPVGATPPNIDDRLLGIRTMQVSSLLKSWLGTRILGYTILSIGRNATNRRKTDIKLSLLLPLAEKEIEIIIERTV